MKTICLSLLLAFAAQAGAKEDLAASVVKLTGAMGGTAFYIRAPGSKRVYLLSNAHVCQGSTFMTANGQQVPVLSVDDKSDLCLLAAPSGVGAEKRALDLTKKLPPPRTPVLVIGFPGLKNVTFSAGVFVGHILSPGEETIVFKSEPCPPKTIRVQGGIMARCIRPLLTYRLTALGRPGSSGSPVLLDDRSVLGIAYAINTQTNELYAITYTVIQTFLEGK